MIETQYKYHCTLAFWPHNFFLVGGGEGSQLAPKFHVLITTFVQHNTYQVIAIRNKMLMCSLLIMYPSSQVHELSMLTVFIHWQPSCTLVTRIWWNLGHMHTEAFQLQWIRYNLNKNKLLKLITLRPSPVWPQRDISRYWGLGVWLSWWYMLQKEQWWWFSTL